MVVGLFKNLIFHKTLFAYLQKNYISWKVFSEILAKIAGIAFCVEIPAVSVF